VRAYGPYIGFGAISQPFIGRFIRWDPQPDGSISYYILPGHEHKPVESTWRYFANYVNWLHSDKAPQREAFESGAYDTSTFSINPGGTFNDQLTRSPGARYWIPSRDEWIKASHFSPDRYGPGMPGYWLYSHSSDSPPVLGPPGSGEASAAGIHDVASYPDVQSPWGLWDTARSVSEWTEGVLYDPGSQQPWARLRDGSSYRLDNADNGEFIDSIYIPYPASPGSFTGIGLRLARAVPAPGSAVVILCASGAFVRRRRSSHELSGCSRGLGAGPDVALLLAGSPGRASDPRE